MPEKLLSIKEVSEYLKISEEEVKRLVDIGEIPAYKIGDTFLRFRREHIDAIRKEVVEFEEREAAAGISAANEFKAGQARPRPDIASARQYEYTVIERIADFFYFNDFYILCFIIIGTLMYLIFKS